MCLGVVAGLLLNLMDVFRMGGGAVLCVVPVITMSVYVFLPYALFVFLYVGSDFLI